MKTQLPEMIVIGPGVFRVVECKRQGYDGWIAHSDMAIEVRLDCDEQYQASTLMHEIQHGLFNTIGEREMCENESLVERLSHAWLNTLISSPGLLDYLKRIQKRTREV